MKSLKIIQTLSKIAWIICKVIFVLCIVGASVCFVSLIVLSIVQDVTLFESKVLSIAIMEKGVNLPSAITACIVGMITCGVGIFLAKYSERFFRKELDLGTPFNKEIVQDMRKLALVHLIVTLASYIGILIMCAIIKIFYKDLADFHHNIGGTFSFAICMLVLSLFCEYGTELENKEVK
jgi:hypothetical protein